MKKVINKQKFSLNERIAYHSKKVSSDPYAPITPKEDYALGFCQGAERGFPLDFDEKGKHSKFYKAGCRAGVKASEKSKNIKF